MTWRTIGNIALAALLIAAGTAAAQTPAGRPIRHGRRPQAAWISREPQCRSLSPWKTVGGNAHTCSLEGKIRNGKASIQADASGQPCVVEFQRKGQDLNVTTKTPDSCRGFCGARAWFEGTIRHARASLQTGGAAQDAERLQAPLRPKKTTRLPRQCLSRF